MGDTAFETLSEHGCFGGRQGFYRHDSRVIGLPMKFAVFVPPQAAAGPVPVLFYLAGLTCTEETFPIKAGAQRMAAELGLMLVAPDTSPRGANVPGEAESWDFGVGAGFYLDAVREPWARHWRMESYITGELRQLVASRFPADPARRTGCYALEVQGDSMLPLYRDGDVLIVDVTPDDVADLGVRVVRGIVPGFQPIHFGADQARLGHQRLFTAPHRWGWRDRVATRTDLNPDPHPLA